LKHAKPQTLLGASSARNNMIVSLAAITGVIGISASVSYERDSTIAPISFTRDLRHIAQKA